MKTNVVFIVSILIFIHMVQYFIYYQFNEPTVNDNRQFGFTLHLMDTFNKYDSMCTIINLHIVHTSLLLILFEHSSKHYIATRFKCRIVHNLAYILNMYFIINALCCNSKCSDLSITVLSQH